MTKVRNSFQASPIREPSMGSHAMGPSLHDPQLSPAYEKGGVMNPRTYIPVLAASLFLCGSLNAAALATLHTSCSISAGDKPGMLRLRIADDSCGGRDRDCGSSFSDDTIGRFTGLSAADLSREGAQLTATLNADAGVFTCAGTVHNGALAGSATFTPNEDFVARMSRMGFTGYNSEKLQTYALLDVGSAWVESLKNAHVEGMTKDNVIALRIFRIDPAYVSGFSSLGYGVPDADKLIALKVQGVNAQEVREIRDLGYKPTLDDLIQIRIFHITPEFIRSMQARGFHDLTIAKLVQIKIFKLDE
ncbi:MAG TPA: hypothetical protein VKB38_12250 [Terracidiphilus sp.]|nr:hypothetical protein [Terracidiphilus sp.]